MFWQFSHVDFLAVQESYCTPVIYLTALPCLPSLLNWEQLFD